MNARIAPLLVTLCLIVTACESSTDAPQEPGPVQPVAKGNRSLALDIKEAEDGDWAAAMQIAVDAGVDEVKFSLDWDALQDGFDGTGIDWTGIIDASMAAYSVDVTLVLRPLDTVGPTYPDGIPESPLNDAAALSAFNALIDSLHARLPGLRARDQVEAILIGNEIDGYLGSDPQRWSEFGDFYRSAVAKVRSLDWGATQPVVSSILMFGGAIDPAIRTLYLAELGNDLDAATVNYYPLAADFTMRPPSDVSGDFRQMVLAFPDHEIRLQECGYASSATCNSSEALQSEFVAAVFEAWDAHADRISLVDFAWLTDVSEATADGWVDSYGMSGSPDALRFKHYLWSLGLRTYAGAGSNKAAFTELQDQAQARGW